MKSALARLLLVRTSLQNIAVPQLTVTSADLIAITYMLQIMFSLGTAWPIHLLVVADRAGTVCVHGR